MNRPPRDARGFTLVELLVVIGIIAVLMSLLLPVVNRVRTTAQTTATSQQMSKIVQAIANYQLDFNGYPGVLPNSAFGGNSAGYFDGSTLTDTNSTSANYTQSEDLVMALLGGLNFKVNTTLLEYQHSGTVLTMITPLYLGTGPVTYNPATPGKHKEYLAKLDAELSVGSASSDSRIGSPSFVKDTIVPEFIDQYSSPRPILYIRGNPGAVPNNSAKIYSTAAFDSTCYYYSKILSVYADSSNSKEELGTTTAAGFKNTFTTSSGGPRGDGKFILLDAGPDRLFGTSDDIIYGPGGGQ